MVVTDSVYSFFLWKNWYRRNWIAYKWLVITAKQWLILNNTKYRSHFYTNVIACFKNCLNTNIYSYLDESGGKSSNLQLNVVHFLTPVLIRHLWQLKTVFSSHWCLICALYLISWSSLLTVVHVSFNCHLKARNTKGGSITVLLTSCLTGLD